MTLEKNFASIASSVRGSKFSLRFATASLITAVFLRFRMKWRATPTLVMSLLLLSACVHDFTMRSKDGQELTGRYRFARDDSGLMQIFGPGGETLKGRFVQVARPTFVSNYEQTFGHGSIVTYGPDISAYGNPFAGVFGSSSRLSDTAVGETFDSAGRGSETAVQGPLFYWTASLRGDRGTTMQCYLIGSSYTGHGFGKCKSDAGHEYSVDF